MSFEQWFANCVNPVLFQCFKVLKASQTVLRNFPFVRLDVLHDLEGLEEMSGWPD